MEGAFPCGHSSAISAPAGFSGRSRLSCPPGGSDCASVCRRPPDSRHGKRFSPSTPAGSVRKRRSIPRSVEPAAHWLTLTWTEGCVSSRQPAATLRLPRSEIPCQFLEIPTEEDDASRVAFCGARATGSRWRVAAHRAECRRAGASMGSRAPVSGDTEIRSPLGQPGQRVDPGDRGWYLLRACLVGLDEDPYFVGPCRTQGDSGTRARLDGRGRSPGRAERFARREADRCRDGWTLSRVAPPARSTRDRCGSPAPGDLWTARCADTVAEPGRALDRAHSVVAVVERLEEWIILEDRSEPWIYGLDPGPGERKVDGPGELRAQIREEGSGISSSGLEVLLDGQKNPVPSGTLGRGASGPRFRRGLPPETIGGKFTRPIGRGTMRGEPPTSS